MLVLLLITVFFSVNDTHSQIVRDKFSFCRRKLTICDFMISLENVLTKRYYRIQSFRFCLNRDVYNRNPFCGYKNTCFDW